MNTVVGVEEVEYEDDMSDVMGWIDGQLGEISG